MLIFVLFHSTNSHACARACVYTQTHSTVNVIWSPVRDANVCFSHFKLIYVRNVEAIIIADISLNGYSSMRMHFHSHEFRNCFRILQKKKNSQKKFQLMWTIYLFGSGCDEHRIERCDQQKERDQRRWYVNPNWIHFCLRVFVSVLLVASIELVWMCFLLLLLKIHVSLTITQLIHNSHLNFLFDFSFISLSSLIFLLISLCSLDCTVFYACDLPIIRNRHKKWMRNSHRK